jgi:hypothetical protein
MKEYLAAKVTSATYDRYAAYLCAVASAWVYSDVNTMAEVMARQGLGNNTCTRISAENDALFVVATADFVLSADGEVGVLCFRGTEPTSIINWLTDFTVRLAQIPNHTGLVHGGMYRNLMAIWDDIVGCLQATVRVAPDQAPLPLAELGEVAGFKPPSLLQNPMLDFPHKPVVGLVNPAAALGLHGPLKALYITGHSLGGAMAAFAAVRLLTEAPYNDIGAVIKGVYTFGQPLVANQDFVNALPPGVARAVNRHIYDRDIVPRLPAASMAPLMHFGPERTAVPMPGPGGEEVPSPWSDEQPTTTVQVPGVLLSGAASIVDYFTQQFTKLRKIHLPYSLENHLHSHYISSSLLPPQRSEFDPPPSPPA